MSAVSDILALTGGPKPGARWLAVLSADEYTGALPIDVAMDPATLLVYEMNGEVLPREHGYPARLLVPGRYGMKNPKWVVGLRPTSRDFLDWYGQRNWNKDAFVRTMTRIDSPAPGAKLRAGQNMLSGVAYAGTRGIKRVEYSSDGGQEWQDADVLEPAPGQDAWVRWRGSFAFRRERRSPCWRARRMAPTPFRMRRSRCRSRTAAPAGRGSRSAEAQTRPVSCSERSAMLTSAMR